jgi:hypothetical protein
MNETPDLEAVRQEHESWLAEPVNREPSRKSPTWADSHKSLVTT